MVTGFPFYTAGNQTRTDSKAFIYAAFLDSCDVSCDVGLAFAIKILQTEVVFVNKMPRPEHPDGDLVRKKRWWKDIWGSNYFYLNCFYSSTLALGTGPLVVRAPRSPADTLHMHAVLQLLVAVLLHGVQPYGLDASRLAGRADDRVRHGRAEA